jgi:hypothetical protein
MTDKDGKYNYNASEQGGSYMIQPYKMDEVLEGVNTLDLVVLQRHLLGVKRMDNPYHLIAADIDNDKRIALNDIVALRRVVLGISEEFENNRPWRFVPKSHVFSEDKPFELQEFTEITNINASLSDQDFMILKTGDLDASFVANALTSRSKSDYSFEYETKGSEISFYASERIVLSGFEMNLHLHNFKDIKDGVLAIEHFHYDENQLKISYVRSEDKVIEKGDKLFTLVSGSSTNQILVKEAQNSLYNENLEILDLSLRPRSINELRPTVSPNPFNNTTTITFATEQNQVSTITFFDIQGKLIFTDKVNSSSEIGQYEIQRSILKSTGVYYIKIQSGAKTTSAKMILTD